MGVRSVDGVDITDVENPVDNVEKPSVSGERAVENPVDEVDKKLHRGCQNNFCGVRPSGIFWSALLCFLQEARRRGQSQMPQPSYWKVPAP